ncbi:hypothetical protein DXT77_23240 [Pseudomonas sp. 91RF]|nr:hypothetical protein DXT77_23240 [Pseudomonas sp. 91RF]
MLFGLASSRAGSLPQVLWALRINVGASLLAMTDFISPLSQNFSPSFGITRASTWPSSGSPFCHLQRPFKGCGRFPRNARCRHSR